MIVYCSSKSTTNLEGEFMEESGGDVEASVQNDQLRLGLLRPVAHGGIVRLVSVQLLLHQLGQLQVLVVVPEHFRKA